MGCSQSRPEAPAPAPGEALAPDEAAVRHARCGLREFVVSTQIKEKKTGQNRVSKTEEHNCVQVSEIKAMSQLRVDFFANATHHFFGELTFFTAACKGVGIVRNGTVTHAYTWVGRAAPAHA